MRSIWPGVTSSVPCTSSASRRRDVSVPLRLGGSAYIRTSAKSSPTSTGHRSGRDRGLSVGAMASTRFLTHSMPMPPAHSSKGGPTETQTSASAPDGDRRTLRTCWRLIRWPPTLA